MRMMSGEWGDCLMARFETIDRNIVGTGLTLVQIYPDRAVDLRHESKTFGWLFYRHPDGQFVSLRKIDQIELDQAYYQAADMSVMIGPEVNTKVNKLRAG